MMILKKYVLFLFVKVYLLTTTGLIGIYLLVDFFERLDEFVSRNAPLTDLLSYYLYKIPFIANYMAPQGVLLATVITLASLARNNEFTAMKACGISITGITFPIIGASVFVALLVLANSEFIAPVTSQKMNYIFLFKVRNQVTYGKVQKKDLWLKAKDNSIWSIDSFNPNNSQLNGVIILIPDSGFGIRQRIDARTATWAVDKWNFRDGYVRKFDKEGLVSTEYFENRSFSVSEIPTDFAKVSKLPEEMSLREMYATIQVDAREGKDTSQKRIELHRNLSYPFISIVLALIAIPLSLRSSRHGGLLFCVGVNLGMGFVFSFLYAISISLGRGGTFDPILAAWGPNVLFTALGFYLLLTLDSEKAFPI
ncbi:MAG: LPS export ABC transporter permease LptG [Nitrospina sp.]|jgi:lipopolysaccharide export system permease protein|nr:LPS export ABC transporter permease LptG [Nitrospina sp.]